MSGAGPQDEDGHTDRGMSTTGGLFAELVAIFYDRECAEGSTPEESQAQLLPLVSAAGAGPTNLQDVEQKVTTAIQNASQETWRRAVDKAESERGESDAGGHSRFECQRPLEELPASLPQAGDIFNQLALERDVVANLDGDLGGRIPPILAAPAFDGIKVTDPALDSAIDLVGRIESRGTRNELVPQGLKGADVLGLRATENSHEVTLRDRGSVEERKARLESKLGLGKDAKYVLDDSWEDETGYVRSKARKFKNKGILHDAGLMPPGDSPLRPSLPLLYNLCGEPAEPSPGSWMTKEELQKFTESSYEAMKDPSSGQYNLGFSEALAMAAFEPPSWQQPLPPYVQKLCGSVLNQNQCSFKLISTPSGTPNPNRIGRRNMEDIESGLVRWLRVTNLGDYRPQPKFHLLLTWAEILGQHCSSFFEVNADLHRAIEPSQNDSDDDLQALGDASMVLNDFKISFLEDTVQEMALEEHTQYCVDLIEKRFAQFNEYLLRKPEHRQCVMCKKGGAECVPITIGDYEITGLEWADPHCWHMSCRACITDRMARTDMAKETNKQRCPECRDQHGGFQIHNEGTSKLMLMQAAQQILLFFGPRAGGDADETFDERTLRRACIKAVIDHGFGRALAIQIGANRIMEVRGTDISHLQASGCWTNFCVLKSDTTSTGYDNAALQGRVLLKLCEAEAMLDNFDIAADHASRAADLLSTLDRGSPCDKLKRRHPARELILPARQIAKKMKERAMAAAGPGTGASGGGGGGGGGGGNGKKNGKKKGGKKGGKKKK